NSADPAAARTFVDAAQIAAGSAGFVPSTLAPSTASTAHIADVPSGTPLTTSVVDTIIGQRWDADELLALANIQGWSVDQLQTEIETEVALQTRTASGELHVFRQRAAGFGHNAPYYPSLPASLRIPTVVRAPGSGGGVKWQAVDPAFPNWEDTLNF